MAAVIRNPPSAGSKDAIVRPDRAFCYPRKCLAERGHGEEGNEGPVKKSIWARAMAVYHFPNLRSRYYSWVLVSLAQSRRSATSERAVDTTSEQSWTATDGRAERALVARHLTLVEFFSTL